MLLSFCPHVLFIDLFIHTNNSFFFFSFPIFFGKFQQENYASMCGHYGSRIVGVFVSPLTKCQAQLPISFGGLNLLSMEDYAPSAFLGSWA
jgi:hypothetical protein